MDRPTAAHKAILASLLIASVVIPVRAARVRKLRKALVEIMIGFGVFGVVYLVLTLMTAPGQ